MGHFDLNNCFKSLLFIGMIGSYDSLLLQCGGGQEGERGEHWPKALVGAKKKALLVFSCCCHRWINFIKIYLIFLNSFILLFKKNIFTFCLLSTDLFFLTFLYSVQKGEYVNWGRPGFICLNLVVIGQSDIGNLYVCHYLGEIQYGASEPHFTQIKIKASKKIISESNLLLCQKLQIFMTPKSYILCLLK